MVLSRGYGAKDLSKRAIWITVAILLLYYLPFTSGLYYWASGTSVTDKLITPFSWALSAKERGFTPIATKGDIDCVHWIIEKGNRDLVTVCDSNGTYLLIGYKGKADASSGRDSSYRKMIFMSQIGSVSQCYVFLTDWNIRNSKYTNAYSPGLRMNLPYSIETKMDGELLLYVFDYKGNKLQPALVKEVYRSGNSIVYEKLR